MVALLVGGCGGLIPTPQRPVVATPAAQRTPAPAIAEASPPRLPLVQRSSVESGAQLWVVARPEFERLYLSAVTSRSVSQITPLLALTTAQMAAALADRLDGADVRSFADSHGAVISMSVAASEFAEAIQALRWVMTDYRPDLNSHEESKSAAIARHHGLGPEGLLRDAAMRSLAGETVTTADSSVWDAQIQRLSLFDVLGCRQENWQPSTTALIAAGPLTGEHVREVFQSEFANWIGPVVEAPVESAESSTRTSAKLRLASSEEEVRYVIAYRAPGLADVRRPSFELLVELIENRVALRGDHLEQAARAALVAGRHFDFLSIAASGPPQLARHSLTAALGAVERHRESFATAVEIAAARRRVWTRLRAELEGPSVIGFLARAWRAGVAPQVALSRYEALRYVQAQRLNTLAVELLAPDAGVVAISGELGTFDAASVSPTPVAP